MIATFYSFKGGVGRSMALANVAEMLAERGYRVIACDWDLEAPGLERFLYESPEEVAAARRAEGIIDLVNDYKTGLTRPTSRSASMPASELNKGTPEPDAPEGFAAFGGILVRRPSSKTITVPPLSRPTGGSLQLLTSGRRDGEWADKYNQSVQDADWADFYATWAGGSYFEFLRKDLQTVADIVLIDSRTGLTELGGVCTHHLADMVFLCSAANEQNIEGTLWMARVLTRPELRKMRDGRSLCVVPVPARIEVSEDEATPFRHRFEDQFWPFNQQWLSEVLEWQADGLLGDARNLIGACAIPYVGSYAFRESLIARKPPEKRHPELFRAYSVLAEIIVRWGTKRGGLAVLKQDPTGVVRELSANASIASVDIPKGEFVLTACEMDREATGQLARELRTDGLVVWAQDRARGDEPLARELLEEMKASAGCVLIVPSQAQHSWLEAELNAALRTQALKPGYRVLVLRSEAATQYAAETPAAVNDLLKRVQVLEVPTITSAMTAARVIKELGPPQILVPETAPATVVERLKALTEHESRFFFGRDDALHEILARIHAALDRKACVLVVAGTAGVGKSTLLRAGVVPQFRRGLVGSSRKSWRIAFAPLKAEHLEQQVLAALAGAFELKPAAETNWSKLIAEVAAGQEPLLLILDNVDKALAGPSGTSFLPEFARKLQEVRSAAQAGFFLIGVVQTGSMEKGTPLFQLADVFPEFKSIGWEKEGFYRVEPLGAKAVQTFLTAATRLLGLSLEPGLLDLVLEDLTRFNASPWIVGVLVQHLWERRTPTGQLTHQAYRELRGIEGVILQEAEQTLEGLTPAMTDSVSTLISGMVDARTQTRLSLTRDEVLTLVPEECSAQEVLTFLTAANILSVRSDGRVTLANDSLLTNRIIRAWLEKSRGARFVHDELEATARRWEESGRPEDFLPRGTLLKSLEKDARPSALARSLLEAAQVSRARGNRRKTQSVAAMVLVCLCLLLAISATTQKGRIQAGFVELSNRNVQATERIQTLQSDFQHVLDDYIRATNLNQVTFMQKSNDNFSATERIQGLEKDLARTTTEKSQLLSAYIQATNRSPSLTNSLAIVHLPQSEAKLLFTPLRQRGFTIDLEGTNLASRVTYFDDADRQWALAVARFFTELGMASKSKVEPDPNGTPDQIDVWLSPRDVVEIRNTLYPTRGLK